MPYVIIRNAEMLPDAFDPSLHGDIDLLVGDCAQAAELIGARKVHPERYRVHYEIPVAGKPVRLDLRFVGDGYYDTQWERRMLDRSRVENDISLPHPEDAFFALVYHALFQKKSIAPDYAGKAAALARAAGHEWTGFADALRLLEDFLSRNGYGKTVPDDLSVYRNNRLINWQGDARVISDLSGATDVRPYGPELFAADGFLEPSLFSGILNGKRCLIRYFPDAEFPGLSNWKYARRAYGDCGEEHPPFWRTVCWHRTGNGGSFSIDEQEEGESLELLLARRDPLLRDRATAIAGDLLRIATSLERANVVHRNINPRNLIVTADGHVKLTDFSLATSLAAVPEDGWFDANPALIARIGASGALAPGQWNDRHALLAAASGIPFLTRENAWAALSTDSDRPNRTAVCTARQMRRLKRARTVLCLKKLLASFSKRQRKRFAGRRTRELDLLNAIIPVWREL